MHASQFSCSIGETMMASRMSKSPFSTWVFPMSTSHRVFPEPGWPKHSQIVSDGSGCHSYGSRFFQSSPRHDPYRLAAAHSPPWPHSALRGQRGYPEASAGRGGHDCRPSRLAGGVVLRGHTSFHAELGRLTTQVIDAVAYPVSWAFRWTQRAGVNHTHLWTPPGLEGQLPQG